MGLLRSIALAIDKSISRAANTFELTRGRIPPGACIAALWPHLAHDLIGQIEQDITIITGTNGKCTTSRFLAHILQQAGHETLHTEEVAASMDEVTSILVQASNLQGVIRARYGTFGFDPSMLYEAVNVCNPQLFILNNLYFDGLDFEGGPDALMQEWRRLFNTMTAEQHLLINADDPILCGGFVRGVPPRVTYFGVEDERLAIDSRAARFTRCHRCGTVLSYRLISLAHLGDYTCNTCGWERPMPSIYAVNVEINANESRFRIITPLGPLDVHLGLAGLHNVYNAVAATAAAVTLGIKAATIRTGLEMTVPMFGRDERVTIHNRQARLMLIKNPTSLNENLRTTFMDDQPQRYLFLVDDEIDAGGDVSWIWDADLKMLATEAESVHVAGSGADHLVLRLKHAEVAVTEVNTDIDDAFHQTMRQMPANARLWVMATDAAMFELRQSLKELGVL
jgi:UDP-N-acetylmuramyl tripeptide synthase